MISRYAPSCIVHIACRNYINYGINDYVHEAETCTSRHDTCRNASMWLRKIIYVLLVCLAWKMSRFVSPRVELVRRKLKTSCPKRMIAGVMIGETLSSEVEISVIIQAINSISTTLFVQNMAAGMVPRTMDSISRLHDAYCNEI